MKNLTVICEVPIDTENMRTINRSVNEILLSYSKQFDTVHYIGPCHKKVRMEKGFATNIYISTFDTYGKKIKNRIGYYLKFRKSIKRFEQLLKESETDIVQIRLPSLFALPSYKAAKRLNLPITTYLALDWSAGIKNNYRFPGVKLISSLLDKIQNPIIRNSVPVSAGPVIAERYKSIKEVYPYYSTTHNEVVYNEKNFPANNILFVGRFEERKRIQDLIDAIQLLKNEGIKVKLYVVGDGPKKKEIEHLVKENNLSEQVILTGNISDFNLLKKYYIDSDILVLPSLSEGTPKVLAEAMAYGVVPIAVNNVGSTNYIITNHKNGVLVNEKSPQDIAEAISNIRTDKNYHDRLINNGYAYAEEHKLDIEVKKLWNHVNNEIGG